MPRIRLEVLVGNANGIAFWRSIGFQDYCVTMEMDVASPDSQDETLFTEVRNVRDAASYFSEQIAQVAYTLPQI